MNPFDNTFGAVEPPSIEGLTVLFDRRFLGFGQNGDFGADRFARSEVAGQIGVQQQLFAGVVRLFRRPA